MSGRFACVVALSVIASILVSANSEGFLAGNRKASTIADFQQAMGTVMGCGAGVASEHLANVERALVPMWRTLPKNQQGMVEWRMVRYVAHRYFLQQSSLLVRGFEPMRQINSSDLGAPELLGKHVESALGGKQSANGFTLHDVVTMIATLEQLIIDGESSLLADVYAQQRKSLKQTLDHDEISKLMEAYMVHWMLDGDQDAINMLLANGTLIKEVLPKWDDITGFVKGTVKSMEVSRQRLPQLGHGKAALAGRFSFEDAHEVVGDFTKKFASFWENECQLIKESLVEMDKTNTGRVSLTDFYGANSDGEWRFGESEAYLRELGALDESSPWRGKQVIISNYLLGPSNCIVSTPHYLVCCVNECEAVLNEVEDAVGAPLARPDEILSLVGNMSGLDDVPPNIDSALRTQLLRIAETHDGMVPLHGRLFAQWLHYIFPRECPFPHRAGAHSVLTPSEYGANFVASDEEVSSNVAARNETGQMMGAVEEVEWMSQWSEEEELRADYSMLLKAPWDRRHIATGGLMATVGFMIVAGILTWAGMSTKQAESKSPSFRDYGINKAHYV
jgi:hypothetical protein